MRRVAVKVAYLGRDFFGSQIQPGVKTVEGDILEDLKRVNGGTDLKMASRTDRGVNAAGNVAVFSTGFDDNAKLLKALNAVSGSIFYTGACDVPQDFNPRHAEERIYRYILRKKGIDAGRAKECASLFVGTHDFARFCKNDDRKTVINMKSIEIAESDDEIILEFRATHFLWNMIRRIVGAVSAVGAGDASLSDVSLALAGGGAVFGLARPDALTLCGIVYSGVEFETADIHAKADEKLFPLSLDTEFYEYIKNVNIC